MSVWQIAALLWASAGWTFGLQRMWFLRGPLQKSIPLSPVREALLVVLYLAVCSVFGPLLLAADPRRKP